MSDIVSNANTDSNDSLFETVCHDPLQAYREYTRRAFLTSPLRIASFVSAGICAILCLWFYCLSGELYALLLAVWAFIYPPFCVWEYFYTVKVSQKRERELHDHRAPPVVRYFDTKAEVYEGDNKIGELDLRSVKRVISTQNHVILYTRARMLYPISKDGFQKGTYKDFCNFWRAKGYKVKN